MNCGKINLFIGPAKSGKTTELIRQINRYLIKDKKICVILSPVSNSSRFETLDVQIILTYSIETIIDNTIFLNSDIIIIDDLHFFTDIEILPVLVDRLSKNIYCSGLDVNNLREIYKDVIKLIPMCEKVNKLTGLCNNCKNGFPGIFSSSLEDGEFVPICRSCITKKEKTGYLHVICGPMFSGKSTELIRLCNQYKSIGHRILSVNYSKDVRYSENGDICTHNKKMFKTTYSLSDLSELIKKDEIKEYNIIAIDEVQFLKNAFDSIVYLVEELGKTVIVSGLDGDFRRAPFGDVCSLISFADKVTRLSAVCKLSKNFEDAPFSRRICNSEANELIGAEESYIAASRTIYLMEDIEIQKMLNPEVLQ